MAGSPFKVGRFAHTLRVRLMREHLGVDVDALDEEDLMSNEPVKELHEQDEWDPESEQERGQEGGTTRIKKSMQRTPKGQLLRTVADGVQQGICSTVRLSIAMLRPILNSYSWLRRRWI